MRSQLTVKYLLCCYTKSKKKNRKTSFFQYVENGYIRDFNCSCKVTLII